MLQLSPDLDVGAGTYIDELAIVGVVGRAGAAAVVIGPNSTVRSHTVIYAGVVAGRGFNTGHGALIRENNRFGNDVSIGSHATIEPGNVIGDRTRVHSGCFLENVTLGNDVFVGPNVVFTDDPHPVCRECMEIVRGAIVEDGAAIGANSTILPGVRIGRGALVGAGSVVTKDVPPEMVVFGHPATVRKRRDALVCRAKGPFDQPFDPAQDDIAEDDMRGLA